MFADLQYVAARASVTAIMPVCSGGSVCSQSAGGFARAASFPVRSQALIGTSPRYASLGDKAGKGVFCAQQHCARWWPVTINAKRWTPFLLKWKGGLDPAHGYRWQYGGPARIVLRANGKDRRRATIGTSTSVSIAQ